MKGNLTSRARARTRTLASLMSLGPLLLAAMAAVVVALPAVAHADVSPQTRAARIRIEASHGMGTQAELTVKPLAELGQVCNTKPRSVCLEDRDARSALHRRRQHANADRKLGRPVLLHRPRRGETQRRNRTRRNQSVVLSQHLKAAGTLRTIREE